ncbi:hypothetical protein [Pyxidicoccus sp. MSG2]|uniref:hypothetical protein n=1 Tax=Pyxidicoccus sp. MSG2 TaxID=2996790 RepID=UPI00226EDBCC|nr:hypothetical protein [Pyxidicoccus sp. MSG2]MCY1022830.1 hypothetical protein [Pyxidicoccus sp. MSG2]
MRVSEHFNLGLTQPSLDFVDVDIERDLKVFVDPRSLRLLPSQWGAECVSLVQNFFQAVLTAIAGEHNDAARQLLSHLKEPNETHLGLSREKARGRALGTESAYDLWEALSKSDAVKSGLLEDLEDTILMVEGIGPDIVSDITTNLIREPLIAYTQDACTAYGIPMASEVDSGPLWDPTHQSWHSEYVRLPVVEGRKLLLVPKVIVRRHMAYDQGEYYRDYILEHLKKEELEAGSALVKLLKNGEVRVTKKDLEMKYGRGKKVIVRETRRNPEILARYRNDKRNIVRPPLTHHSLANDTDTPPPDWDTLLHNVLTVAPGNENATTYHHAVQALLTALFYPSLVSPQREFQIHEGRKRVDITFTNAAFEGFFEWLSRHYPSQYIFVECKNYTKEINNPELDQLAGRFSPNRGKIGLIVCRRFDDKELFIKRCLDTAHDDRGFIVPLDDEDLRELVEEVKSILRRPEYYFLRKRFERLIMS